MFKKEKTVIFGVSDPKSVRFEHVPNPIFFWGDVEILAILEGQGDFCPILRGLGMTLQGKTVKIGGKTKKIILDPWNYNSKINHLCILYRY